jgi:ribosomal protein L7/L12
MQYNVIVRYYGGRVPTVIQAEGSVAANDMEVALRSVPVVDLQDIRIFPAIRAGDKAVDQHVVDFIRKIKAGQLGLNVASIKFIRETYNCGLKEAKDAYDSI